MRQENDRQRQALQNLNNRVNAVEDTSRKLAEKNGVNQDEQPVLNGAGGPFIPLDAATALEFKTRHLEQQLRAFETIRQQAVTHSI